MTIMSKGIIPNDLKRIEENIVLEPSGVGVSKFINAMDLLKSDCNEIPSLLAPLLPSQGLVALAGASDTGKSSFLRQLACTIAKGEESFLGFPINTAKRNVVYVSTEDDENSLGFLLKKQNGESANLENLELLFDVEDLFSTLEEYLKVKQVCCVIIDAFGDIIEGDLNRNDNVRGQLKKFKKLSDKYECLFIFLHHTGKGRENLPPSKNNLIGSQGFEAKMRVVMEFRKDPNDGSLRHLCFVKGNYLTNEFKEDSFVLNFDENMTFSLTGERIPFDKLTPVRANRNELMVRNVKILELEKQGLSSRKISKKLEEDNIFVSKSTVSTVLKSGLTQEEKENNEQKPVS